MSDRDARPETRAERERKEQFEMTYGLAAYDLTMRNPNGSLTCPGCGALIEAGCIEIHIEWHRHMEFDR